MWIHTFVSEQSTSLARPGSVYISFHFISFVIERDACYMCKHVRESHLLALQLLHTCLLAHIPSFPKGLFAPSYFHTTPRTHKLPFNLLIVCSVQPYKRHWHRLVWDSAAWISDYTRCTHAPLAYLCREHVVLAAKGVEPS